jgi:hypothetical protein
VVLDERGGFNPNDMIGSRILAEARLESFSEVNTVTGKTIERESTKIFKERPAEIAAPSKPAGENGTKAPKRNRRQTAPTR